MTEDERQYLVEAVSEAHASLSEVAFKLRREVTPKAPALKAAIKGEREIFRLKRELQRLDIKNLEQAGKARIVARGSPGREGDRRGAATAAKGPTRQAMNRHDVLR